MPATYEPIATTTTTGNVTDITLSSIPATYTDLRLVFTGSAVAGYTPAFYFNGDTSSLYSVTTMTANTTTVVSSRSSALPKILPSDVTYSAEPRKHLFVLDFFNYAGSTFKTVLFSCTSLPTTTSNSRLEKMVGLYRSTNAISSITISTFTGSDLLRAGNTVTLFGIKAA